MSRHLARPPIATDRLSQFDDGRLNLRLTRPWRDGTTDLVFTPHELIERLVVIAIRTPTRKSVLVILSRDVDAIEPADYGEIQVLAPRAQLDISEVVAPV